mmetsp:Transcript_4325/g.12194  ORF Transcript_4325/g.12194 Transcript_4325/m.12194 type:complete len:360 (+) Transcript_4325:99-1178(+)
MPRIRIVVAAFAFAQGCSGFSTLPLTAKPAQLTSVEQTRRVPLHAAATGTAEVEVDVGKFSAPAAAPASKTSKNKRKNNGANKKRRPKSKVNGSASAKSPASANNKSKKKNSSSSSSGNNKKKRNPRPKLQPMSALKLGSKIDGVICGISEFGAFVKTRYQLRPKDENKSKQSGYALLHKSQIQDEKVDDVSKVLRVGDHIKNARVIGINYAKGEVSISLRKPRPKRRTLGDIQVGKAYDGKVANVTPYGCFVDIGAKKNALLHISRITQEKVTNIRDYVSEGDWLTVHIIGKDDGGLACSMLDKTADEYLNKRQRQQVRKQENKDAVRGEASAFMEKGELAAFEEAIRELEQAFSNKK